MKSTIEQSCLSRSSIDQVDSNARKLVVSGKHSLFDRLFPFYDHFFQSSELPVFVDYIGFAFFALQFFFVSFWSSNAEIFVGKEDGGSPVNDVINSLIQFLLHITPKTDSKGNPNYLITFIAFTACFLLIVLFLVIEITVYTVKRRFIDSLFYLAHFLIKFLNMIILVPLAIFAGTLFVDVWNYPEAINIMFLVLTVIYFAVLMVLFSITIKLLCNTPFIPSAPYAGWNYMPVQWIFLSAPIFGFLELFFHILESWTFLVLVVFHMIVVCLLSYWIIFLPFIPLHMNVFTYGLCVASGIADVFVIISYFSSLHIGYIICLISIVLGIVASVLFYIMQRRKIKRVRLNLSPEQSSSISDSDKVEIFESLGVHKSENNAYFCMRVGLSEASELFIDWSLTKFIFTNHDSNRMSCLCVLFMTFFPSESRLLNTLFTSATRKRHLNLPHRFLLYQVNRIRSLRTSSSSNDAAEKLQSLIQTRHRINDLIHDFWLTIPSSTLPFSKLYATLSKSNVLWQEAIKDYPNSTRIAEEYSNFLIDCSTNFIEGIKMKRRVDLIDSGQNFSIDISFKTFVRTYPNYIKKGIIGIRGNFINKMAHGHGSSSGSSNSADKSYSLTTNSEIDIELEEQIGQTMFTFSRMRLALQRALISRKSKYIKMMNLSILIAFIVSAICFIVSYILLKGWFQNAQESLTRQLYGSHARFTASIATLCLALQWGKHLGKFSMMEQLVYYDEIETEWYDFIDFSGNLKEYNVLQSSKARSYFGQLLTAVANLAQSGVDVYLSSSVIISRQVPTRFCDGDLAVDPVNGPLASMFAYNGFMRSLTAATPESQWANLSYLCYSLSNAGTQTATFNSIYNSFYEEKLRDVDSIWAKMKYLIIIIPIVMFCISAMPSCIFVLLFNNELKSLPVMFRELDASARKAAAGSLASPNDEVGEVKNTKESKESINASMCSSIFITFIINLAPIALILGEIFYSKDLNERFGILHGWLYYGSSRAPQLAEITMNSVLSILALNGLNARFVNYTEQFNAIQTKLDQLIENNDALLRGKGDLPPCFEYDSGIDSIHYTDVCTIDDNSSAGTHDAYRCASLNQNIITFQGFVNEILKKIDLFTSLDSDVMYHLIHISNNHMFQKIMASSDRIAEVSVEKHDSAMNVLMVFLICGLILSIFILVCMFCITKKMNGEYSAALVLIRRVQPQSIITDSHLTNYLLNKESQKNNFEMTLSNAVIFNSDDSIICLSKAGIIEIVNPAVTKLLGFTPEQLLGQPTTTLLAHESTDVVMNQLDLMRNGQSTNVYEDHIICTTDNDTQIPCHITILGIKNETDDSISSIVIILHDETDALDKQKEAEEAKKQSENLLYQILPQDIVLRLNQGEVDISFTVPSASIIFIDIVRFSEYMATLTPQQTMTNLSQIFASFDVTGSKYPLLTKIKLIGDVYMAATGLFSPDDQPKNHAEAIIKFGLDALNELDDLNMKLNSNLAVRIGVNSGGPILAGVLGTDKPVFDIIGDTINVASRLQSTCVPGQVQISQATYDLVHDMDFFIEPRGEVFLKGKGKQQAYLVKPKIASVFKSTDYEFSDQAKE